MAKNVKNDVSKDVLRKELEADVDAFLKKGGVIEVIETGRSGVDSSAPRDKHIKLGNSKKSQA